jgi:glutathione S-transferase
VAPPTVYGADYSVYVRTVRLALEEKAVEYRLETVDIFADDGPPAGYEQRHPFLKIPAFEHDGFKLFEAAAIMRYVDEVFDGPALMPATAEGRARANQITGVLDSYAYRCWVWDIFVERSEGAPDEDQLAAAMPRAETCLQAIEALMTADNFMLGPTPSLADLHAAPMIDLLRQTPEGERLLADHPRWLAWWQTMSERPSMAATQSSG